MEKPKTTILHLALDMEIGGAEQVIKHLVRNLDKNRFSSIVGCLAAKVGTLGQTLAEDAELIAFARTPGFDWSLIKRLRNTYRNKNIGIVHCHQYTPYVYGLLASIGTSTQVIFTEHGRFYPDVRKPKRVLFNKLAQRFTFRITAISNATKQALDEFEGFHQKHVDVIYNGIEDCSISRLAAETERAELRENLGLAMDDFVVGTISRLDPIKNQRMMIDAVASLRERIANIRLLMIGDGPVRVELEKYANERGVAEYCLFTGFIVDPQKYLHTMDVFLLSSLSEGTSMTLLESMCNQVPSVVTNVGGNPEVVENSDTGFLVDLHDSEGFAHAIYTLYADLPLRIAMGTAARQRFVSKFSVEEMVSQFEELYSLAKST